MWTKFRSRIPPANPFMCATATIETAGQSVVYDHAYDVAIDLSAIYGIYYYPARQIREEIKKCLN